MTAPTKTATFVRALSGWRGDARLYRLSEPLAPDYGEERTPAEYVIVSAVVAAYSGPETYIFPATADGAVVNYGELPGSFRGALDHAAALDNAGYAIAAEVAP